MEVSVSLMESTSASSVKKPVFTKTTVTVFGPKANYTSAVKLYSHLKDYKAELARAKRSGDAKAVIKLTNRIRTTRAMIGPYMSSLGLGSFDPVSATVVVRRVRGTDTSPVGKKYKLEFSRAGQGKATLSKEATQHKAAALLKRHTFYELSDDGKEIFIKNGNPETRRATASVLCDVTNIGRGTITVTSPVLDTIKVTTTKEGIKAFMEAIAKKIGSKYAAFRD